ncbi:hypothetical protein FQR65_LT10787 [Abscondita terminalis]|nr:hypothetical protein FQR65_LT10787 [Abscondita terminalis]
MMLRYSNEQLATIIGVPIVTVLLIWTVAIFHKNRKKWSSYDIAVVAILIQSVLRNLTVLAYTALIIAKQGFIPGDYCKAVVWTFNSLHTFQASSLTTLAVIAMFTVKMYKKQQNLQQYLTATHVIYHLFCLTTLCACVGVASILAQEDNANNDINFSAYEENAPCKFMPYELDVKFNIFIIVLHIFLAMVSFTAFVFICFNHFGLRRQGFDYLKKSTSDLSELSLSLTASLNDNANKSYYDTYTVQRLPHLDQFDNYETQHHQPPWNSDLSNISMTVSSTNSKRPCLKKAQRDDEDTSCGLHTMYPILTVCYLFNHLPLILLCIFPRLIAPWTVSGVALWMGQLQDVLVPIGLGLVDSRFCEWVSTVYKCVERRKEGDKIPPGDGKFRHFGSQPQSLEITQTTYQVPKFPITNGSLYTSIDGRLPIIHNYRRQKGAGVKTIPNSLNLHSTHLKRQEYARQRSYALEQDACGKCETKLLNKRISLSEDSLCRLSPILSKDVNRPRLVKNKRNKLSLGRISKSHDCLNDLQIDLNKFRQNPEVFEKKRTTQSVSSDDEYFSDGANNVQDFDATSQSSFSITTEANCDFEFYQNKSVDLYKTERKNFVDDVSARQQRITRSNSKRSLENFRAYVNEESSLNKMQRSNSFMNVDGCKYLQEIYKTKPCGGSVPDFKRVFISEYI